MHISLFWTGGPYAAAVRKAGEESPTRLICLTNTAGAATRPLPPVPSLSCLLPISRRERLPRCVSWREKRRGWRRRGGGGCQHVCVLICRVCVNIDLPYEQLCHYIILTLFISPFFFVVWPTICKGHRYRVSKESVWVVCFLIWLPPTPTPLVFF